MEKRRRKLTSWQHTFSVTVPSTGTLLADVTSDQRRPSPTGPPSPAKSSIPGTRTAMRLPQFSARGNYEEEGRERRQLYPFTFL